MKTKGLLLVTVALLMMVAVSAPAGADTLHVADYGWTDWQHYSFTFNGDWSGTVGIGVSNWDDTDYDSALLLDNLVNLGPEGNRGFELGDFSGYDFHGNAAGSWVTTGPYGDGSWSPTEGDYLAVLWSNDADTPYGGGTDAAWLSFELTATQGQTVSFDWAFWGDEAPYYDYAFVLAQSPTGETDHFEKLAEIGTNPVPLPPAVLLLGAGLVGLGGLSRRRRG
jgi:hypothetical protein